MNATLQLDKAAPVLAGLKQPIVVAKVDADKYRKLASKHDVVYVTSFSWNNSVLSCLDSTFIKFFQMRCISSECLELGKVLKIFLLLNAVDIQL